MKKVNKNVFKYFIFPYLNNKNFFENKDKGKDKGKNKDFIKKYIKYRKYNNISNEELCKKGDLIGIKFKHKFRYNFSGNEILESVKAIEYDNADVIIWLCKNRKRESIDDIRQSINYCIKEKYILIGLGPIVSFLVKSISF